jgi:hypothetical protein
MHRPEHAIRTGNLRCCALKLRALEGVRKVTALYSTNSQIDSQSVPNLISLTIMPVEGRLLGAEIGLATNTAATTECQRLSAKGLSFVLRRPLLADYEALAERKSLIIKHLKLPPSQCH